MCNKIHHSITAGVSASAGGGGAGGGGAGSGRGGAAGRGKHPRYQRPHVNVTEGQETVRDMSFDCVVSKGYNCLVAALLGRTQNDGRMTTKSKTKQEDFYQAAAAAPPPSHNDEECLHKLRRSLEPHPKVLIRSVTHYPHPVNTIPIKQTNPAVT